MSETITLEQGPMSEDDLDFIRKMVLRYNSQPALYAALEACKTELSLLRPYLQPPYRDSADACVTAANAALAKAEGGA